VNNPGLFIRLGLQKNQSNGEVGKFKVKANLNKVSEHLYENSAPSFNEDGRGRNNCPLFWRGF
jgi:hypothetical protein